ncbi:hypothetical protein MMC20_000666 [Loxospora ochrophaea]|nr:hypothetical protein [Loxospora ochrophaea]
MARLLFSLLCVAGVLAQAQTIDVSIGLTIIESSMGGSSASQMINAPSMSAGATHMVTVGGTQADGSPMLAYTPPTIEAAVGDMVQFNFMTKNHTATQSTFAQPCVAMPGGMNSMFMPNADNTVNPPPMFKVQVTAATPMWFYCQQTGHCGKGMVFSINPTANKTQADFEAMAVQQNGTAAAMPAAAPPAVATMMTIASAAAISTPVAASAVAAATSAAPSVAIGNGESTDGSCSCSCLCGQSGFPAMGGMGNFGGYGGSLPASGM